MPEARLFIFKMCCLSFYYEVVGVLHICFILVKYVLPVRGLLFHFLKVCFDEQKFQFLKKSNLSIFYDDCFLHPEKPLPTPKPWKYSPLCSFKGFIIFDFTFMSVMHFKLTFVSGVK